MVLCRLVSSPLIVLAFCEHGNPCLGLYIAYSTASAIVSATVFTSAVLSTSTTMSPSVSLSTSAAVSAIVRSRADPCLDHDTDQYVVNFIVFCPCYFGTHRVDPYLSLTLRSVWPKCLGIRLCYRDSQIIIDCAGVNIAQCFAKSFGIHIFSHFNQRVNQCLSLKIV